MSIFTRSASTPQQTATAPEADASAPPHPDQTADQTSTFAPPRNAAPGVVPPPAAPVYSMRPAEGKTTADARVAKTVQQNGKTQLAAQRSTRVVSQAQARRRALQQAACAAPAPPPAARQQFDALRAAQTGLLKLAWSWQQAGAPIRAIHAYTELIFRYPDSEAASAAIADLVELSDRLACQGQFHTALAIYDHLEEWAAMEEIE